MLDRIAISGSMMIARSLIKAVQKAGLVEGVVRGDEAKNHDLDRTISQSRSARPLSQF
jgi:hypothetical protein